MLAVGAHVLLPGPQRSSAPGGGTESTEQTLDLDEISLWLESDRLSSRPEGKVLQPEQRHRKHRPDVRRETPGGGRTDTVGEKLGEIATDMNVIFLLPTKPAVLTSMSKVRGQDIQGQCRKHHTRLSVLSGD